MAVAFRSATSGQGTALTTITQTVPAGTASGDIMLMSIMATGGTLNTVTPPSGWNLVRRDDSGTLDSLFTYWHIAGGSETSNSWGISPAANLSWDCNSWSGADIGIGIDANVGQANASSTTVTYPSITTNYANDLVISIAAIAAKETSYTQPTGFTARTQILGAGTNLNSINIGSNTYATPQTVSGLTGTWVSTAAANFGTLLALAPVQVNNPTAAFVNRGGRRHRQSYVLRPPRKRWHFPVELITPSGIVDTGNFIKAKRKPRSYTLRPPRKRVRFPMQLLVAAAAIPAGLFIRAKPKRRQVPLRIIRKRPARTIWASILWPINAAFFFRNRPKRRQFPQRIPRKRAAKIPWPLIIWPIFAGFFRRARRKRQVYTQRPPRKRPPRFPVELIPGLLPLLLLLRARRRRQQFPMRIARKRPARTVWPLFGWGPQFPGAIAAALYRYARVRRRLYLLRPPRKRPQRPAPSIFVTLPTFVSFMRYARAHKRAVTLFPRRKRLAAGFRVHPFIVPPWFAGFWRPRRRKQPPTPAKRWKKSATALFYPTFVGFGWFIPWSRKKTHRQAPPVRRLRRRFVAELLPSALRTLAVGMFRKRKRQRPPITAFRKRRRFTSLFAGLVNWPSILKPRHKRTAPPIRRKRPARKLLLKIVLAPLFFRLKKKRFIKPIVRRPRKLRTSIFAGFAFWASLLKHRVKRIIPPVKIRRKHPTLPSVSTLPGMFLFWRKKRRAVPVKPRHQARRWHPLFPAAVIAAVWSKIKRRRALPAPKVKRRHPPIELFKILFHPRVKVASKKRHSKPLPRVHRRHSLVSLTAILTPSGLVNFRRKRRLFARLAQRKRRPWPQLLPALLVSRALLGRKRKRSLPKPSVQRKHPVRPMLIQVVPIVRAFLRKLRKRFLGLFKRRKRPLQVPTIPTAPQIPVGVVKVLWSVSEPALVKWSPCKPSVNWSPGAAAVKWQP